MTDAESLKQEILSKVAEYYRLAQAPKNSVKFVPGETKINYAGRVFDENEMVNLTEAALEFWLTYGHWSKDFEKGLEEYLGVRHVLMVNSGSSANLLAFMTLTSPLLKQRRICRGDEVITVAAGFPTTIAPIVQYGAVLVFVDMDPRTVNVDVSRLEAAYSSRTKAVMLAHTLGNPFDLPAVKDFCDRHGLWLIEDNCDALGSRFEGRLTGTWGDIGTSSFYPPHHLTTGEGGAVYTNDPLLAKIALSMRDWGRDCWCQSGTDNTCGCRFTKQFGSLPIGYDHKYVYSHFGYNLKATDLQAAIGCAQLKKFPSFVERRKSNYAKLKAALGNLDAIQIMEKLPQADPSWFGFLMTVRKPYSRNGLAEYLESRRIQTRNLFAGNILRHPCFEDLVNGVDYRVSGSLDVTDEIMNSSLWIGLYPGMRDEELDYMARCVVEFFAKYKGGN